MSVYEKRGRLAAAVLTALFAVVGGAVADASAKTTSIADPLVVVDGGAIRGATTSGGYFFGGVPYAAAPTGEMRWRPPAPVVPWNGVRDATQFAASCPQVRTPVSPAGPYDEDCLFLNVYAPSLRGDGRLPVIVWFHGGGWTTGAGRDYDGMKLAQHGAVVVTINYRLGALGYLAHPALAEQPGGSSGNYGQMDQQAALRWVQRNVRRFGGDPRSVTIAGESAGAVSVLFHLISPGSRGLFQRAIVESGSFAPTQQSLAAGEAFGQAFATSAGCPDQSAACLRNLSVSNLVDNFPGAAIPGIVDGAVIQESVGQALAAGRFTHVPVLNGINHDEQRIFVTFLNVTVTGGFFVPILNPPITADNYQTVIAQVLGVSAARAAAIATEYPVGSYPSPAAAFSTLDADAWWACTALQMDIWTAKSVPTFAYEFDDDNAPPRYAPPLPVATHTSELSYIFDLPSAPFQTPMTADQETLAGNMRAAWASFAATGDPAEESDVHWPAFNANHSRVLSLLAPQSEVIGDFASRHHCAFWAGA